MLASPFPYIVCVDFKTTQVEYTLFTTEIQASYKWWHFLSNTWLVLRYETLVELQGVLVPKIYVDDRMLILPAYGPGGGWLPKEAFDWINENMTHVWGGGGAKTWPPPPYVGLSAPAAPLPAFVAPPWKTPPNA